LTSNNKAQQSNGTYFVQKNPPPKYFISAGDNYSYTPKSHHLCHYVKLHKLKIKVLDVLKGKFL